MSYATETYPVSIDVRVTFVHYGEVDTFDDAIKGETIDHAMTRARENWPGAEIEFLGITDPAEVERAGAEAAGITVEQYRALPRIENDGDR